MEVYRGSIVYPKSREELEVFEKGYIAVENGVVEGVYGQAARSVQLSKLKWLYEPEGNRPVSFPETFYMATKKGGEIFGHVGSLEKGYRFDALVIDGVCDPFLALTPQQIVERFCYTGTKEQIAARFLGGNPI